MLVLFDQATPVPLRHFLTGSHGTDGRRAALGHAGERPSIDRGRARRISGLPDHRQKHSVPAEPGRPNDCDRRHRVFFMAPSFPRAPFSQASSGPKNARQVRCTISFAVHRFTSSNDLPSYSVTCRLTRSISVTESHYFSTVPAPARGVSSRCRRLLLQEFWRAFHICDPVCVRSRR
jgi:hypothetical protein